MIDYHDSHYVYSIFVYLWLILLCLHHIVVNKTDIFISVILIISN